MNHRASDLVAGARGMVGSAIVRRLLGAGHGNVPSPGREQLDLLDQAAVRSYLAEARTDYMFIAAAKVGGIQANNRYRADFTYQNLQIGANLIHGAHFAGVQRLMFPGSSCVYPRDCRQPIKEEYLLTGRLEPTNEAYAIAKIAGIKLAESYNHQHSRQYVSLMPTNLYEPNDNYDLATSHVLPALIHKADLVKQRDDPELVVWGSGTPRREFLYFDDLADACVHMAEREYDGPLLAVTRARPRLSSAAHRRSRCPSWCEKWSKPTTRRRGATAWSSWPVSRPMTTTNSGRSWLRAAHQSACNAPCAACPNRCSIPSNSRACHSQSQ